MGSKKIVIAGAAGYAARKHYKAIQAVGGEIVAAIDPHDNLEILDEYFPQSEYFVSIEEAETWLNRNKIDYFVICSPSHLHAEHIEFGLKYGNVICESPAAVSKADYERIVMLENQSSNNIFHILQYRYDSQLSQLKKDINKDRHNVIFRNYSYRGKWFEKSWKGDPEKSGGLLVAMGYHFFDALMWIYGSSESMEIWEESDNKCTGLLKLKNATIQFELNNRPAKPEKNNLLYLEINGKVKQLSNSDEFLYAQSYSQILNGLGFSTFDLKEILNLITE